MKKEIKFIDLLRPSILDFKINSMYKKLLKENNYIMGYQIFNLEEKLKKISGSKYAIACSNGTDALILSLMSLNLSKNDIVFVPAYTFASTAESVAILGAKPFFVDISKETLNIDIESLKESIFIAKKKKYKIKCIIAVDLFGKPCDRKKLLEIAKENNLSLIFDSAQSFGGKYKKNLIGSIGDITITSFFPTKPLGCFGDGGAIFTNNEDIYKKIISLRNHGSGENKYENIKIGMNARLDTIQAITLIEKLFFFKKEIKMRRLIAMTYNKYFKNYLKILKCKKYEICTWSQYSLIFKNSRVRNAIKKNLYNKNICTNIYYNIPLHKQEAYKKYPRVKKKLNISENVSKKILNLPIYPYIEKNKIFKIILEVIRLTKTIN